MKNLFGLIFGILGFLITIAAAVGLYFFYPHSAPAPVPATPNAQVAASPNGQATGTPGAQPSPPIPDEIKFEMMVRMPPPLDAAIGKRLYSIGGTVRNMAKINQQGDYTAIRGFQPQPPAAFPYKIFFSVAKSDLLLRVGGAGTDMVIGLSFCMGAIDAPCLTAVERFSVAILFHPTEADLSGTHTVNLGDIYMTGHYPSGDPITLSAECKNSTGNFTGKVTATADFLAKAAGHKVAIAYMPYQGGRMILQRKAGNQPAQLSDVAYQVEFIQPSASGVSYSIPISKIKPAAYMRAIAAICDPGEDPAACVNAHYPARQMVSADGKGFQVMPAGLKYVHCSAGSEENLIMHAYTPTGPNDKPSLAHDRNPAIPGEIVEHEIF